MPIPLRRARHQSRYALVLAALAFGAVCAFLLVRYQVLGGVAFAPLFSGSSHHGDGSAAALPAVVILLLPRPGSAAAGYADLHRWLNETVIAPFKDIAGITGGGSS